MNPFFYALAAIPPLLLLAKTKRIFPHRPLIVLIAAPGLLSLTLMWIPALYSPLLAFDALVVALSAVDLLSLPRAKQLLAERQALRIASLKKAHPVHLTITNRSRRALPVWVRDGVPAPLVAEPNELLVRLAPRSRATLRYVLHAGRRGAFTL